MSVFRKFHFKLAYGLIWFVTLFLDALCYILQLYKRFLDTTLLILQICQKWFTQRIMSIIKIAPRLPPSTRETTHGTCMRASSKLTCATFRMTEAAGCRKRIWKGISPAFPQPSHSTGFRMLFMQKLKMNIDTLSFSHWRELGCGNDFCFKGRKAVSTLDVCNLW